jgi:DNA-binding GntR family transcriptional regulator
MTSGDDGLDGGTAVRAFAAPRRTARPRSAAPRPHRSSLDHVAAGVLREHLADGRLRPGDRLREIPLARDLSFSRSTVRKALQFLAEEGLVVLVPYTGWLVARLDAADVRELVTLRSALEGLAAGLAAERVPEARPLLEGALATLESVAADGNRARVNAADFDLHKTIVHASGHRRLERHYALVERQVRLLIASSDALIGDLDAIVAQHREIVAAILSGDRRAAMSVAEAHNLVDGESLLRHLAGSENGA